MGARLPGLTLSGECWINPVGLADPVRRRGALDAVTADNDQETVSHVSGSIIIDRDASFIQRFMMAFWMLCDQRIASVSRQGDQLPASARTRTPAPWEDVQVVALRRIQTSADTAHDARDVRWQHRWVVQMHKRHQWYPSLGTHKIIFVGPYVKGPDGAPLKPTAERVQALLR